MGLIFQKKHEFHKNNKIFIKKKDFEFKAGDKVDAVNWIFEKDFNGQEAKAKSWLKGQIVKIHGYFALVSFENLPD